MDRSSDARQPWDRPETVAGFSGSPPNEELMRFAEGEYRRLSSRRLVDLGCGAGRNGIPLAEQGWSVFGIDLSTPMLHAAVERARQSGAANRFRVALASMDRLPFGDGSADLVVAHGIWNLARSATEFRQALGEASRVAKPRAGLFVFTFSRSTLSAGATPVAGEPFVFTDFSGHPQCFLTGQQLVSELRAAGFEPDSAVPLRELNLPRPGALHTGGTPVIYEGTFRRHRRVA